MSVVRKNKERLWEVIRLRSKGEYLGRVEAKDTEAAKKVAVKEFKLAAFDRRRLLIRPACRCA